MGSAGTMDRQGYRGIVAKRSRDAWRVSGEDHAGRLRHVHFPRSETRLAARAADALLLHAEGEAARPRCNFPEAAEAADIDEVRRWARAACGLTSRYRGVTWDRDKQRWRAEVWDPGAQRMVRGGRHTTEEAAADDADRLALRIHGQEAKLNFGRVQQSPKGS